LQNAGFLAKLTLTVDLVPLVMALVYLVSPTERHLSLMRPCSLAGLFAALAGGSLGFLMVLRGIGATPHLSEESYRLIALGASESLVPMFFGFACLSVAWLLVGAGMSRWQAGS